MQQEEVAGILLREQEILVLLTGLGFRQAEGIFTDHCYSKNEVIQTLFQLVKKGELTQCNKQMRCADDVRNILQNIGTAKRILYIEQNGETYCIYCGQSFVLCEAVKYSPELLRFTNLSEQQLIQWLDMILPMDGAEKTELTEQLLWNEKTQELLRIHVHDNGKDCALLRVIQQITGVREIEIQQKEYQTHAPYDKESVIAFMIRAATERSQ